VTEQLHRASGSWHWLPGVCAGSAVLIASSGQRYTLQQPAAVCSVQEPFLHCMRGIMCAPCTQLVHTFYAITRSTWLHAMQWLHCSRG
jgi:hypothetical protein